MLSVILMEPERPGNIGAVARVMANFNIKDLVLVNPKCDHKDSEAIKRSKHGLNVLKKAKVIQKKDLKRFHTLVATTSKISTDYNIQRAPLSPDMLAELINPVKKEKIGLVFGRESEGLHNSEIRLCDFVVTIPTKSRYKALNLSHAVAIILYELFKEKSMEEIERFALVSEPEKRQIMKLLDKAMNNLDFENEEKRETQRKVWKRMVGKSFLTKREAFGLMGFLRKIGE